MVANESILNSVQLLVIVNDHPTCSKLGSKYLNESICVNRDADADETMWTGRCKGDVPSEGSECRDVEDPTKTRTPRLGRKEVLDTLRSSLASLYYGREHDVNQPRPEAPRSS